MTLGTRPSASFQPAMRPRYAAVDFAFCINGGLSKYGRSFLVLRDYLKHNATYTHCDSFEVDMDLASRKAEYGDITFNLKDVACSYFQFGYVVLFCHPAILKKLHSYAMALTEKRSEENILGGNIYIEAQMHADIRFSQDVAELCISARDCATGPVPHPKYGKRFGSKTIWDNKDVIQVQDNAKKFAKANGIKYVDVP